MPHIIPLGPFDLLEILGRGGMATVYRGLHRVQHEPAAIKVLTGDRARDPRALAAFRREVRAVATLDHPAIVTVFDLGLVSDAAERATGGTLVTGSPFLAMELASPFTVRRLRQMPWPLLRDVLLQVLDALAHAHARGVVHRDLKPDNVLVGCDPDTGTPIDPDDAARRLALPVKLSDFGIAHILDHGASPDASGKTAGTPAYMAPEQLQGRWRDYGPWTDLYALGCMAYELCCGRRPFVAETTRELVDAHLGAPPPPLDPMLEVPAALEAWVHTLMAKDPARRFRRAADAAWALLAMPRPATAAARGHDPEPGAAEGSAPLLTMAGLHSDLEALAREAAAPPSRPELDTLERYLVADGHGGIASLATTVTEAGLPMPASWRREERRRSMKLIGAGLGLYDLRPVPMVDRDAERDAVWAALRRVCARRSAEVIVLRGSGGSGKHRLARWMAERAHELGAASVLEVTLDEASAPGAGIARLVAEALRCAGLSRAAIYRRVARTFEDCGLRIAQPHLFGLTELMRPFAADPDGRDEPPAVHFDAPAVRHAVVRHLLRALARRRPLMALVGDAHLDLDALGFALDLLEWQRRMPTAALLVLAVDDDALARRPAAARRLAELTARPDVTSLSLGPLAPADHRELVEKLLRLESELARQVAERTAGHPLFAVQLVGDWVQRQVLVPGERGFRLREGERAEVPDDIHALWMQRIEEVSRALALGLDETLRALELAAVLGHTIDATAWRELGRLAGAPIPAGLVDLLVGHGLATLDETRPGHWRLGHRLLRESLERTARAAGRWERWQQAAVQMLRAAFDAEAPDSLERLEHHLSAAGQHAEAGSLALRAARQSLLIGDAARALAALDRHEDALLALDVPMADARWRDGWLLRAEAALRTGDADAAEQALDQVEAHGHHLSEPRAGADVLRLRGELDETRGGDGADERAAACYQQAIEAYHALGELPGLARSLERLAALLQRRQRFEQAAMYYEGAMEMFERLGDLAGVAGALRGVATVCADDGQLERARELLERAASYSEHAGDRLGAARALTGLVRCALASGDAELARTHAAEAQQRLDQLGARQELAELAALLAG